MPPWMHEKIHQNVHARRGCTKIFSGSNRGFGKSEEELLNEYFLFLLEIPDVLYSIPLVGHNSDLLCPVGFLWNVFLCAGLDKCWEI
jgi:hypothetical protein